MKKSVSFSKCRKINVLHKIQLLLLFYPMHMGVLNTPFHCTYNPAVPERSNAMRANPSRFLGWQRDQTKARSLRQETAWRAIFLLLIKRRTHFHNSNNVLQLSTAFIRYLSTHKDYERHVMGRRGIKGSLFSVKVFYLSKAEWLFQFRFTKKYIRLIVPIMAWTEDRTFIFRSRYGVTLLLKAWVFLRRMASSCWWKEFEGLFE